MVTAKDEYANLKARLLAQRERKAREMAEIEEALKVLNVVVPDLVGDTVAERPPQLHKTQPAKSIGLADAIRQIVDRHGPGEVIRVPEVVFELRKKGMGGKNLYNNVYTSLDRDRKRGRLAYEKDVGFFKPGAKDQGTLVASTGPEGTILTNNGHEDQ